MSASKAGHTSAQSLGVILQSFKCPVVSILICLSGCFFCSPGSGGVSAGREERPGEHETGPGETNQNAGICPQARKVSRSARWSA